MTLNNPKYALKTCKKGNLTVECRNRQNKQKTKIRTKYLIRNHRKSI